MTTALRRLTFVSLLAVAGTYAAIHLRGPNGVPALLEKRKAIQSLEAENLSLRQENEKQRKRNVDLSNNADLLRQEIQRRHGKVPDGAVEFRTDPDDSPQSSK